MIEEQMWSFVFWM